MWAIYKTKAAAQFSIIPPTMETGTNGLLYLKKPGSVLIEMAEGSNRVFDWAKDKKVSIGLSDGDLSSIYKAMLNWRQNTKNEQGEPIGFNLKLVHDTLAGTDQKGKGILKTFSIFPTTSTDPKYKDTFYFSLSYTGSATRKVSIGIDKGELYKFLLYVEQNQNFILGERAN